MRRSLIAGNWKMNNTVEQSTLLIADLLPELQELNEVERVICPPFPSLMVAAQMLVGTSIGLGAQNMHWEDSGAYTGEVSPFMIKELCQYVILGHSERRGYFCEKDEEINKKVKVAFAVGLIPIVCIGETLDENEAQKTNAVLERQILIGLDGISHEVVSKLIVAYEPVWAIGTGKAASPQITNKIIRESIRENLAKLYGSTIAEEIRVLYGGSVKSTNAAEYFSEESIDGALVGGASLNAREFIEITRSAKR